MRLAAVQPTKGEVKDDIVELLPLDNIILHVFSVGIKKV